MRDCSCFSDFHVRVESTTYEASEGSAEDVIGGAMCARDEAIATRAIRGGRLRNITYCSVNDVGICFIYGLYGL